MGTPQRTKPYTPKEKVHNILSLRAIPFRIHRRRQVTKALQLQLATCQRIGVILVGPSGAGKSTLWRLLEGAYVKLGRRAIVHRCALPSKGGYSCDLLSTC
jgi:ABC-type bacteriocin/lantibiotic exporter with double-glycine peptidase domain